MRHVESFSYAHQHSVLLCRYYYCVITINLQSTFLPKNFSQRRFKAVYGVYMCQRFYRKIKIIRQNSPNFWWIGTFFEQFPKFIFTVSENVIHPTRTFLKNFCSHKKIWRNLANFFLSCDKIFDMCGNHR